MTVKTDSIAENTAGAGVTVDGLLIKDGALPNVPGAGISTDEAAALAAYYATLAGASAGEVLTASGPGAAGFAELAADFVSFIGKIEVFVVASPTLVTIHNDTGKTFTLSKPATGTYILTISSAFPSSDNLIVNLASLGAFPTATDARLLGITNTGNGQIIINSFDFAGNYADIPSTFIGDKAVRFEVRYYP